MINLGALPPVRRLQEGLDAASLSRLRKAECLWSKGFSQYCDFRGPDWYWLSETESCQSEQFFFDHYAKARGLVWVRLSTHSREALLCDLDNFVRAALPTITRPFALLTTDGDVSVPSELDGRTVKALLECPWLISWHTQNHDGYDHPKLAPLPIGLDLHTKRPRTSPRQLVSMLQTIRERRLPIDQLPLRVFSDLAFSITPERAEAVATLERCEHVDVLTSRLSPSQIWTRYAQYPFVVSARGNGLDCHRTWELLYLGCIVITKRSSLDPLYSGLPVVLVSDWTEVYEKEKLAEWLQHYGPLTDRALVWQRLNPHRYVQPIRQALDTANRLLDRDELIV